MLRLRTIAAPLVSVFCLPCIANAYELEQLFAATRHDFGSVAQGGNVSHRFELRNTTSQTLKISNVESSCHCAAVELSTREIAPGETCHINAELDTRKYAGRRSATVTLGFDEPAGREVQLHLSAYIRSDIEIKEGSSRFGRVESGRRAKRRFLIVVRRPGCRLVGITTDDRFFDASIEELGQRAGAAQYRVTLRLKASAPVGTFHLPVELSVSDRRVKRLVLLADGEIAGPLSASEHLILGAVSPGGEESCNLVVRGREPFRITNVICQDSRFEFAFDKAAEPKKVHIVGVSFRSSDDDTSGTFEREVMIEGQMASGESSCRVRISGVVRVE